MPRTVYLRREGFELLRFWNNDVLMRTDVVCDAIARRRCVARFSFFPASIQQEPAKGR